MRIYHNYDTFYSRFTRFLFICSICLAELCGIREGGVCSWCARSMALLYKVLLLISHDRINLSTINSPRPNTDIFIMDYPNDAYNSALMYDIVI